MAITVTRTLQEILAEEYNKVKRNALRDDVIKAAQNFVRENAQELGEGKIVTLTTVGSRDVTLEEMANYIKTQHGFTVKLDTGFDEGQGRPWNSYLVSAHLSPVTKNP